MPGDLADARMFAGPFGVWLPDKGDTNPGIKRTGETGKDGTVGHRGRQGKIDPILPLSYAPSNRVSILRI
jgi:hypothetical protein